jgi:uncharacterized protein (DUF1015 family)
VAQIFPFNGVRYNQNLGPDLLKVLCPPYDIINPQMQYELYNSNPHNFVRIEFNAESAQDNSQENRYSRAAAAIASWLADGILKQDNSPALYCHLHTFEAQGKNYRRYNLIARVKLEEWDTRIIRPHENIIPRAKSDRIKMLQTTHSNTSEVLAMYEDTHKVVSSILADQGKMAPIINTLDYAGQRHQVWALNQPSDIKEIQQVIEGQPLYIADGHHRYDSALTYRRDMVSRAGASSGLEGFNFVMMALLDFKDPGLLILPTHRLLKGLNPAIFAFLKSKLNGYFDIESLEIGSPDLWGKVDSLMTGIKPDMQKVRLAIYGLEAGKLSILTSRDIAAAEHVIAGTHSQIYKRLDVSLVDHVILDSLLGFVKDQDEGALMYTHDRKEAIDRVDKGEFQLAFILNPVRADTIKVIADARDRMPRKSTYFYPKSPAGLVFYKW